MEPEPLRPDTNHTPSIQQYDPHRHSIKHSLRRQSIALLNTPKRPDPHRLRRDADDEQVRQLQRVVRHDRVLQRADDGDGRVERVAE